MKVVIVGLPLFAKRLAENLTAFDPVNKYVFLNTYYSKKDQLKAFFHLQSADVVFSINGTLSKSRLFDYAFKKKIPVIMNWVGTDVQVARTAVETNQFNEGYRSNAIHFCEVAWIQEELKAISISAKIQNFAAFPSSDQIEPFKTDQLCVLTYINDARKEFYGIKEILALASRFPQIHFYVVGTTASNYEPLPRNVSALGWVENISPYFDLCQIAIRFPEHDGLATFVLESLAKGKHVLYKYPFDSCIHTPDSNELDKAIKVLQERFIVGELKPNIEGSQFIQSAFNKEVIFGTLVNYFKSISKNQ